jgi:protein-tyrosine phosphatase
MTRRSRFLETYALTALLLAAIGTDCRAGDAWAMLHPSVERIEPGRLAVRWAASAPIDIYLSDSPQGDIQGARLLSRIDAAGHLFAAAGEMPRPYFLLRYDRNGGFVIVSERVLPLTQGSNFRDVGGYPTSGGKRVRWGLIYRSAATPLLSDHDLRYLRALNLYSMVDLRSTEERQLAPTRLSSARIRYIAIDYSFDTLLPKEDPHAVTSSRDVGAIYREWLTLLSPQYQAVFRELLSHKGPLVYNCTAGQDRTGEMTALLLLVLGVPREIVVQDYLLSTQYRHPEYEMAALDPAKYRGNAAAGLLIAARAERPGSLYGPSGRPFIADVFDEIDARWGSIENYMKQVLEIDSSQIAQLRADYLE